MTRNLRPLEKQGLLTIKPGEDRRSRLIDLTELGRDRLQQAMPLWEQAQEQTMQGLGEDQAKALLMKTRGMSEPEAYALLRNTAMNQNRRIADIAESLIVAAGMLNEANKT